MRAFLNHFTRFQYINIIGIGNGRQPVSNDNQRFPHLVLRKFQLPLPDIFIQFPRQLLHEVPSIGDYNLRH